MGETHSIQLTTTVDAAKIIVMSVEPPIPIHGPKLKNLVFSKVHQNTIFELHIGGQNGVTYAVVVKNPYLLTGNPHTMNDVELRACFSTKCTLLNVFKNRAALEFWDHDGFLVSVKGDSCEVTMTSE